MRKDVKNPFGIRDDEPGDEDKDADTNADGEKNAKDGKHAGKRAAKAERQESAVKIEFEGIEQRAIRVPLEADNI